MAKGVLAVVAGGVVLLVTTGLIDLLQLALFPEWFSKDGSQVHAGAYVWNLAFAFPCAFLAGWLTARLAPPDEMKHVSALAGIVILLNIATIVGYSLSETTMPVWYSLALLALGFAGVVVGGKFRLLQT